MRNFTAAHSPRPLSTVLPARTGSHSGASERPALFIVWLRCQQCFCGFFAAAAPGPQPCPACSGGRLQPIALWDLREAAPPGMVYTGEVQS